MDWNSLFAAGRDWRKYLSIRGRNLNFINKVFEILEFGPNDVKSLSRYKEGFSANAVRKIHEAVVEFWPRDIDIVSILSKSSKDVSGLYIGDYDIGYLKRGIVRHSIYANKILIVDPFLYPYSVRDEYSPLSEPAQYRTQTLRNVKFWISILPWIDAGIIEVIRTPAEFSHRLQWDSLHRQKDKFDTNPELKAAMKASASELKSRHLKEMAFRDLWLSAPDTSIRHRLKDIDLAQHGITEDDVLDYIRKKRDDDPDFLEPLGPDGEASQIQTISSGASYDVAQLTASITKSYLFTDLSVKWKEIEIDRNLHSVESRVWSPFAKAVQESRLKYLSNLRLEHALTLRDEGRLESLRSFMLRVWERARVEEPFDEANARLLGEELHHEIREAEVEWREIDKSLVKIVGTEAAGGLLAAGPLIESGHGLFVAAAAVAAGATTLAATYFKKRSFADRFPAAFFMKVDKPS